MSEVNFQELLAKQVDSVERPKAFPIGSYDAIIAGHEYGKSSKKETPYVRFWCKLIGTRDDVVDEDFEAAGGLEALNARKPIKLDFYITDAALWRLTDFLQNSLDLNCAGRTIDSVIPEATNVPLIVSIVHEAGSKEGDVFMNIGDTAIAA